MLHIDWIDSSESIMCVCVCVRVCVMCLEVFAICGARQTVKLTFCWFNERMNKRKERASGQKGANETSSEMKKPESNGMEWNETKQN